VWLPAKIKDLFPRRIGRFVWVVSVPFPGSWRTGVVKTKLISKEKGG